MGDVEGEGERQGVSDAEVRQSLLAYAAKYRRNAETLDKSADFRLAIVVMNRGDVLADPLLDALRNGSAQLRRRADELERSATGQGGEGGEGGGTSGGGSGIGGSTFG